MSILITDTFVPSAAGFPIVNLEDVWESGASVVLSGPGYLLVAANDAATVIKDRADFVCDGAADDVQIQAAIDALPVGGGTVMLSEGTFNIAASVVVPEDTILEGSGMWATQASPIPLGLTHIPTMVVPSYDTSKAISNVHPSRFSP